MADTMGLIINKHTCAHDYILHVCMFTDLHVLTSMYVCTSMYVYHKHLRQDNELTSLLNCSPTHILLSRLNVGVNYAPTLVRCLIPVQRRKIRREAAREVFTNGGVTIYICAVRQHDETLEMCFYGRLFLNKETAASNYDDRRNRVKLLCSITPLVSTG